MASALFFHDSKSRNLAIMRLAIKFYYSRQSGQVKLSYGKLQRVGFVSVSILPNTRLPPWEQSCADVFQLQKFKINRMNTIFFMVIKVKTGYVNYCFTLNSKRFHFSPLCSS
jgi:hypothetical protein